MSWGYYLELMVCAMSRLVSVILFTLLFAVFFSGVSGTSTGSVNMYTSSYLGYMEIGDQYVHFSTEKVFSEVYRRDGYWYLLEPGSTSPWRIKTEADVTISTLTANTIEAYSDSSGQHVLRIYNPYNPSSQVQATVNGEDATDNVTYKDLGNGEYIVELNNISSGSNVQIIISWTTTPIPEPWMLPIIIVGVILLVLSMYVKKT